MPLREFKGHAGVNAVAVFPDKRRMVTSSVDRTLHLWDLKTGVVLKKMEGHSSKVWGLAVSRDGQLIASGDGGGELIVWHGETGESITKIQGHPDWISSLDFSPDGTVLVIGSGDGETINLWNTKTWRQQGNPIKCGSAVYCAQRNASHPSRVTGINDSVVWPPNDTRLLIYGNNPGPTICEWDTTTWKQIGDPWTGHSHSISAIAIHPAGTLVASASYDNQVRLWRLSDRQTIAIFKHKSSTSCVTFSVDGKHILSGGEDKMISEWAILATTTAHTACINGDLSTAEDLLTQDIDTDPNNYTAYAHRSFVMARKHDWDHALRDAIKSISIQSSLIGYISKGISLCGKGRIPDARAAFDVASMYTNQDPQILHFLLLIKVIGLFDAGQHDEANLLLKELTTSCPNADIHACHIVQAYLRVQLGLKALDGACHEEAADHFTAALHSSALSSKSEIYEMYQDLVVIFGWDLKSLWFTAHQKRCQALLEADKLQDAVKSFRYMMDNIDGTAKASCLEWSNGKSGVSFTKKCSVPFLANGDAALAASDFDRAIDFYSAAIDLTSPNLSYAVFTNRSKAKLGKMLWMGALLDAQKVIQLNPSSHIGYKLKHAAFHGAQRYDEAIAAFQIMLSKLNNAPDTETRNLRQQYLCPSEVDRTIRKVIDARLENAPLRVLDTTTGLLCDRETQIRTFKTSIEYKELVSSTITHRMKPIKEVVVTYFRYVMLSHRREGKEPLLQDIQGKVVYNLDPVGGIKLQSFCKTARDLGYRWAWCDTCCIDKSNDVELQESVNSMFVWYHHSALTIVYLSDVPPTSKPGALAKSAWNTWGWTVQRFVAPNVVLFYQKDWTPYLGDRTPNHKDSVAIMQELEFAMGMERRV
ncbi:quinon protein alcohol dehydrogenase-like superfamily [Suillus bovinus]|uniref:quinon protein alcohol dehydrogenase-like superfamily n=1 Tax=Suillus bovinus TaxID=48563 RepID=UPI001B875611|nr:quinon protein alcohol dehydrogenase-like superfamily [Suillus bovinus]KAG2142856.1 quinon protein alcohol dehydrogenase-like superfamily [Suillus bovinus]